MATKGPLDSRRLVERAHKKLETGDGVVAEVARLKAMMVELRRKIETLETQLADEGKAVDAVEARWPSSSCRRSKRAH